MTQKKDWIFLIEAVTSHGPMDGKRVAELREIFRHDNIIFLSAFPDQYTMNSFLPFPAWETEAWLADTPSHLIHFNGKKNI